MEINGQKFNDGVIDLSTLRAKKEEEKVEYTFDPQAIMSDIPSHFEAAGPEGESVKLEVISAICHPDGLVYITMTDGIEGEPPFLMVMPHKNNKLEEDLRPATEEEFYVFQNIMDEYRKSLEDEIETYEDVVEEPSILK